jgi:hypothetical protein
MILKCELDFSSSGQKPAAGSCEHGNEVSCSIKGREYLDQLLKKDSPLSMKLFIYHQFYLMIFSNGGPSLSACGKIKYI